MATGFNPQYTGQYRNYLDNPSGFFSDVNKSLEAYRAGRTEEAGKGITELRKKESLLRAEGIDPSQIGEFQQFYSAFGGQSVPINPVTGGLQFQVPDTTTITSDNLKTTPPVGFASPNYSPIYDITKIDLSPEQKKAQTLSDRMVEINNQLSGKPAFEQEQQRIKGLAEKNRAIKDLEIQIKQLQNEAQMIPLTPGGPGVTQAILGAERRELQRQTAVKALTLNSLYLSLQGSYDAAKDAVEEAVRQKYGGLEAEYDALSRSYNTIKTSPYFTAEEKRQADALDAAKDKAKAEDTRKANQELNIKNQILTLWGDSEFQDNAPSSVKSEIKALMEGTPTEADLIRVFEVGARYKNKPTGGGKVNPLGVTGKYIGPTGLAISPFDAGAAIVNANPNLSREELFIAIRENVDELTVTDIDRLLESKKSKVIKRASILEVAKSTSQNDVENYLKSTYTHAELFGLARGAELTSFWSGEAKDVENYLASPASRKKYAELLEERYKAEGYTIE